VHLNQGHLNWALYSPHHGDSRTVLGAGLCLNLPTAMAEAEAALAAWLDHLAQEGASHV
jgi:hypothetical protein